MKPFLTLLKAPLTILLILAFGACAGKGLEAGLETPGLKPGDQVVIEMKGDFSVGYEYEGGGAAGSTSPEAPISFSITNQKPVSPGEPGLSFTMVYLRPNGADFSESGLKIYMGLDFCTRDSNGDAIYSTMENSTMLADYQPVINIDSTDHNLDKGKSISIGGEVVGVRVKRDDGSSNYYTKEELLQNITYENPGGISDCKLTKNHIMSHAVNSPVRIQLVKAPPQGDIAGAPVPGGGAAFDDGEPDGGDAGFDNGGSTLPGGPVASGDQADASEDEGSDGCPLMGQLQPNSFSGPSTHWVWLGAFAWTAWLARRRTTRK